MISQESLVTRILNECSTSVSQVEFGRSKSVEEINN